MAHFAHSANSCPLSSNHVMMTERLSGEGPAPVQLGLVSTGIDPMHRGPASLEGPLSGNVPAPLPFRLIPTTPDTPFPNPDMRRQTG